MLILDAIHPSQSFSDSNARRKILGGELPGEHGLAGVPAKHGTRAGVRRPECLGVRQNLTLAALRPLRLGVSFFAIDR